MGNFHFFILNRNEKEKTKHQRLSNIVYYLLPHLFRNKYETKNAIFQQSKKERGQYQNAKSMVSCENGSSSAIHTASSVSSFKAKSSLNGNNTYELTHALFSFLHNRAITPRYIAFDRNKSSMKTCFLRLSITLMKR